LEIIWTVVPSIILFILGVPRLELLYKFEGIFIKPDLIVKVVGHQWFWEYNFTEFGFGYDRFTEKSGVFRLCHVSDQLVLPFLSKVQLLVTRHDVIHSFALPSLAVKSDANPGRLNCVNFTCNYPGVQVGQCSELCGTLHSNMRIVVEFTSVALFKEWLLMKLVRLS
jgi:cytochrome c oxidase subunit 2